MIGLLLASSAWAQTFAFPSELDEHVHFYPTAYLDHGGQDWGCGDITYTGHRGSDFGVGGFDGMDAGRTVTAAASGVVVAVNDGEYDRCTSADCPGGGGFGNYVQLLHDDGQTSTYAHLKQWSVAVAVGDAVECGQPLGQVGSSGYSTGPHLHFEVRDASGSAQDPFDGPCSETLSRWTSQGAYAALPDVTCFDPPECQPTALLSCGATLAGRSDGPGATSATWFYGCSEFVYSGPEQVWSFVTELDEDVTLLLTGLEADLDLYVLDSVACDGTGCLGASSEPDASSEQVTFAAQAGREYVVVVDGWQGAAGPFELHVDCVGAEPEPEPEPIDTGDPIPEPEPEPPAEPPPARQDLDSGCGCATGGAGGWPLLGLVALLTGRRR